jgi:6-phosphogluconolactonase
MARETYFIGSYTIADDWIPNARGAGITVLELDSASGALTAGGTAAAVDNPSYLVRAPGGLLAACSELFHGEGLVWTFAVEGQTLLRPISRRTSLGRATCHVAVDPGRRRVLAASYLDGHVVSYDLAQGELARTPTVLTFSGSGPKSDRQEGSHPHQVVMREDVYLIPDLGADRIWVRSAAAPDAGADARPDAGAHGHAGAHGYAGTAGPAVETPPGYGPRHIVLHPGLGVMYVVCELEPRVLVYERGGDAGAGGWKLAGDHPCEVPRRAGQAAPAAIKLHPGGHSLIVSNRFSDSLMRFSVDPASGRLSPAGNTPLAGKTPRDFGFSRDGRWLIALCQDSHEALSYAVDAATGEPAGEPTDRVDIGSPVCIV